LKVLSLLAASHAPTAMVLGPYPLVRTYGAANEPDERLFVQAALVDEDSIYDPGQRLGHEPLNLGPAGVA
jgi:hypothetical protein